MTSADPMTTINPVTNYGVIASHAIDNGCTSLGELLIMLAMHLCKPTEPDLAEMRRVFAEYEKRKPVQIVRSNN
jgi:hypothetical protein